jgi:hypothetical protein
LSYIADIFAFQDWVEYESSITSNEISLWYALVRIFNKLGNPEELEIPISTLIPKCKLSRDMIYKSRNRLKQLELIDFKERKGNQCSVYKSVKFRRPTVVNNKFAAGFYDTSANTIDTQVTTQPAHKPQHNPHTANLETRMVAGFETPLKNKIKNKNKIREKNIKKEKIFSEKSFDELIDDYTQNEKLRYELKEHLKIRKAKRAALTNHAIELSIKKLDTLSGNDEGKIKIVQNAIERGYTSFFELPSNKKRLNPSSGIFREEKPSYDIDEYRKYCRELLVKGRKFEETDVGDNLVCAVESG